MPPKGTKRKAVGDSNGTAALLPPDRNNWPGWVELESEPEIFNIMLKDMDVRGLEIKEVVSLENMHTLPLPIHGLIFLFQYSDMDHSTEEAEGHAGDVWFANQVPQFSCATIAILNLINNIPNLDLGKELREFKEFTKSMDPLIRGDTIDCFDFVRRIHNSFARENDMLNADMVTHAKVQKEKGEQSRRKARETREANKAAKSAALEEKSTNITKAVGESAGRSRRAPRARAGSSVPAEKRTTTVIPGLGDNSEDSDKGYDPKVDMKAKNEVSKSSAPPRRSGRTIKPRKVVTDADYEAPDGYHYVSYVPIGDHVWKLDGMNKYPQDLGTFKLGGNGADGGTGNWLDVVTPMIQSRMSQPSSNIDYSLMAVVRDSSSDSSGTSLHYLLRVSIPG